MDMKKQKIALLHLFANGDCLLATTVAKQIRNDNPNCTLEWIISKKCSSIIINNPDIDIVTEIEIIEGVNIDEIFERELKLVRDKKQRGEYDQVFVTQILKDYFCFYDGIVSSSIYKSFGNPITVDTTPVLINTSDEKKNAKIFSYEKNLKKYNNIVLFECAPKSNQIHFTKEIIYNICKEILKEKNTCIILSAPTAFNFDEDTIIDGNVLSIRETVALTHYCTLLLGCSSGITWACTSTGAKKIPQIQILDSKAYIFNPLSINFKKQNKSTTSIIEMTKFDQKKIALCFKDIFSEGFELARQKHNQKVKKQFKLYRGIVSNFLVKGKFSLTLKFIKMNIAENGLNFAMLKFIILGILFIPAMFFKKES